LIEKLIFTALNQSEAAKSLALYESKPAIFYQQAANDVAAGWKGGKQFPRLDYNVDWTYNPERKSSGSLIVDVWCTNESTTPPEVFVPQLISDLSAKFLTDETGTYCILWQRTDFFEGTGTKEPKTIGVTITFDVLAFPKQRTIIPDPVECIQRFIKDFHAACKVFETDDMPEIYSPTDEAPAVYVRLSSNIAAMKDTHAVQWIDAVFGIHIFAATENAQKILVQQIVRDIAREADYLMENKTTMHFNRVAMTASADPLHIGQISLNAQYGILTPSVPSNPMKHIYFK
jgi:hypothetical protein